jgi:hypothetical protein
MSLAQKFCFPEKNTIALGKVPAALRTWAVSDSGYRLSRSASMSTG